MKMKWYWIAVAVLTIFTSGFLGAYTFSMLKPDAGGQVTPVSDNVHENYHPPAFINTRYSIPASKNDAPSFIEAAEKSRTGVVFIKGITGDNRSTGGTAWDQFFNFFYNQPPMASYGSGVLVDPRGYIATNYHVIKNADVLEVKVSDHNKTYIAEVIGTDPSTDLAVLKIDGENLPHLEYGDSEKLRIGEWVLAVGNPFNLTSTVTAGIVSAKGRNVGVVQNQFPIESFIQTDAAINPGNSGGALVDPEGRLVGINTAIMSKTGSYAGYGFAIPSNMVKKIVDDLVSYGIVQRAFLEAEVKNVDEQLAQKMEDVKLQGAVISHIFPGGTADNAGLRKGDIIMTFNGKEVTGRARFDEYMAYHRPGDEVELGILRDGKMMEVKLELKNSEGTSEVIKLKKLSSDYLGADFTNLNKMEKERFGIDYGVKIFNIHNGLFRRMNIPEGFIILSVNNKVVTGAEPLINYLESLRGRVIVKGITPAGSLESYGAYVY